MRGSCLLLSILAAFLLARMAAACPLAIVSSHSPAIQSTDPSVSAALRAHLAGAGQLRFECALGPHQIVIVADEDGEATAAVITDGEIAWKEADNSWHLLAAGSGLLGGKDHALILFGQSGGAHCCITLHALRLGATVEAMEEVALEDGLARLWGHQLDGRAVLELSDDVLKYWNTGFSLSPFGEVYVVAEGRHWRPLPEVMRSVCRGEGCVLPFDYNDNNSIRLDAASRRQLAEELAAHHRKTGRPASLVWAVMTRLIYSGRIDTAFTFLEAAWPPELTNRDTFAAAYVAALSYSPYFEVLLGFDGERLLAPLLAVATEQPSLLPRSGHRGDDSWGAFTIARWAVEGRPAVAVLTCDWDPVTRKLPEIATSGRRVVFHAAGIMERQPWWELNAKTDPAHAPCN